MIAKYNNISLLLGIPGLIVQIAGAIRPMIRKLTKLSNSMRINNFGGNL